MSARLKVLVAEDSLTVRKYLCQVFAGDPGIQVVGEAENGQQAIAMCRDLRPDLITMDMMMPVMSGLAATEFIMAHFPTPILIVSASTNRGELFKTYEALAAGAVDVMEKPLGRGGDLAWEQQLLHTAKTVARIRVITHPRATLSNMRARPIREMATIPPLNKSKPCVVALGASTGGPGAIVQILRGLPEQFNLPILMVIHISEPFGTAFADWLDGQTSRRVIYGEENMHVASLAGKVVMAPPNRHMRVYKNRLQLSDDAERHSCRPSVDVLFESMATEYGSSMIACLLTGMGRDGAAGLLAIHRAHGHTIAQDEASCIVYGMPREAVELGAVNEILPLDRIAPALLSLTATRA